ncbi:MAG: AraC family transcriptional regulator [Moraxella sp.]|nr:AraC family transcriptional regulator [Moraxella sp.]
MSNQLKRFNQTIDYIESCLDGVIDDDVILRLSGYRLPLFSRIFSAMAGFGLTEYVRKRRLTKSAFMLSEPDQKVIDVALCFGYDSVDAFGAAFKRFHGVTPSAVKQGASFRVFARVHFSLTLSGADSMNISIEQKEGFYVAGKCMQATSNSDFGAFWQSLYEDYEESALVTLGNGQSFGVCIDGAEGVFDYWVGYHVTDIEMAKGMGLSVVQIPAGSYAVVSLVGQPEEAIKQGWRYVLDTFLPQEGYKKSWASRLRSVWRG